MDVYLVTGNQNKVRESEKILGMKLKNVNLDVDEIQSLDTDKVAEHKALQAWKEIKKPLFVIDQSVHISCLNDFPGPLIKWFWTQVTLNKVCQIANHFKDNKIWTQTTVTYFDGIEIKHFYGRIDGTIPTEPRGEKGWAWDPIFIPAGSEKTYSEMEPEEVIEFRSHKIALEAFRDFFKNKK